jgi:hypothetical protein
MREDIYNAYEEMELEAAELERKVAARERRLKFERLAEEQRAKEQSDSTQQSAPTLGQVKQGYDIYSKFAGGGSGGGSAAGGGEVMAGTGDVAGGAMGGGSGGGAGSAMAGAWPVALAAAIVGNESHARDNDYRSEDTGEYAKDLLTTAVGNQDIEKRWLPKIGIKEGSTLSKGISHISNPLGYIDEHWF